MKTENKKTPDKKGGKKTKPSAANKAAKNTGEMLPRDTDADTSSANNSGRRTDDQ